MRDRERDNDHEARWARELDKPVAPHVERQANLAEERLRADGASLADVRSEWASFDRDNPMEGDAIHRDFVRAQQLAYARVVDSLLREEVGEGLRERHAQPEVDDEFADLLAPRDYPRDVIADSTRQPAVPAPVRLPDNPNSEARAFPAAPGPEEARLRGVERINSEARAFPAAPGPEARSPAAHLNDVERIAVQAAVVERIVRPIAQSRPTDQRPEEWYLGRANALDASARGSVDREVGRLKDLPQLSTREAVANAVARTADDFERQRAEGVDNDKLRTRLYALAVVHELRAREDSERLRQPPEAPTLPDLHVRSQVVERSPPLEMDRTDPARPLPLPSTEREVTPGSAPRVTRFVPREDTDPRERDNAPTIPDERLPSSSSFPARDARAEDSTNPGRRNVRAPGPERDVELFEVSTRDIVVEREDVRDDPTLNTRLSDQHRDRSASIRRELASIAADADREYFSLSRAAEDDPEAARVVAQIAETVERLKATPRSHDPIELSGQVNDLYQQERADPDVTDGRLRVERLAYAVLARAAFERESQLLGVATRDAMNELQHMPDDERRAFMVEASIVLREPAYNDRHAMNRELLRDENPRVTQLAALARVAPSIPELERQAKWREDRAFRDRIDAEVAARLTAPERDDDLVRALAEARVQAALSRDLTERHRAHDRAVELAEVVRRLPISRSLDLDTPASPYRPLHN